jgi:hypothetical protein
MCEEFPRLFFFALNEDASVISHGSEWATWGFCYAPIGSRFWWI